ncbi:MAG: hypothetical protein JW936_06145 [Sedimentisphaerales bacterium]|nr:hypothetical protein [Sedimentisphaerales bacterium]
MPQQQYSKHQQGIINRYYENLDTIMLQKLQELTTELYLAKDTPKEDRLWQRVDQAMAKLKVKPAIREHIMVKRRVEVLAQNLQDWIKASK